MTERLPSSKEQIVYRSSKGAADRVRLSPHPDLTPDPRITPEKEVA